ncbi:MAG TPA: hypothetical protein DD644_04290 [Halomonas sp.]|uniref:hypothetical protein n=1 Tax=Halomonadaceae TaxID=28256 RepID=UPI000E98582F|nr:hypothetical protein [Halomonas sp. 3A7M]HBP40961.1 hypothetical protein [Halomonas sp.]
METIDNKDSVLKLSLLALAIVAVTGCSSGGSSSQPIDQDNPGQTDGGGGSSDSGGGSGDSGGGSGDGGGPSDPGQDFTYKTINPIEEIPVGEEFRLDSVTVNATPSSSGVTMNQQPVLDHAAMIEVLPNGPNGEARIRLNAPIADVENRDFTEGRAPYIFDNGEDNDIRIRSVEHESEQFLNGSLNYAAFGEWVIRNSGGDSDGSYFATGYDTHLNDMPSTGSASYSGAASPDFSQGIKESG